MPPLPQPRRIPRQNRSRALVDAILEATARVLSERGYAGTNTNLVAERAGVSVGSVYQYFPNKDSLITALHERHAVEMHAAMETVLAGTTSPGLLERLAAIVHAWLAAHQVAPELHQVLEKEFPFFDAPSDQSAADQSIHCRIRQLLEEHRDEVVQEDLPINENIEDALTHRLRTGVAVRQVDADLEWRSSWNRESPSHLRAAGTIPSLVTEDGCRRPSRKTASKTACSSADCSARVQVGWPAVLAETEEMLGAGDGPGTAERFQ